MPVYVHPGSIAQATALLAAIQGAAAQGGYFAVLDRASERSPLVWQANNATLAPEALPDLPGVVAVELQATRLKVICSTASEAPPCVAGESPGVQATFFSRVGVLGIWRTPEPLTVDPRAQATVLREQLLALFGDITPTELRREVTLADGDDDLEARLEPALNGQVALARELVREFTDLHPDSAEAWYDLAVLTEALGQPRDALAYYDRAIALDPRALYVEMRAECARLP